MRKCPTNMQALSSNTGSASAKDVLDLIAEVQRRVYDRHGVHLEPEVRMIGED